MPDSSSAEAGGSELQVFLDEAKRNIDLLAQAEAEAERDQGGSGAGATGVCGACRDDPSLMRHAHVTIVSDAWSKKTAELAQLRAALEAAQEELAEYKASNVGELRGLVESHMNMARGEWECVENLARLTRELEATRGAVERVLALPQLDAQFESITRTTRWRQLQEVLDAAQAAGATES